MPTAGDEQHKLLSQTNDPDSTLDEEEMLIIPLRLVPLRPLRPSRPQKDGKYKVRYKNASGICNVYDPSTPGRNPGQSVTDHMLLCIVSDTESAVLTITKHPRSVNQGLSSKDYVFV